MDEDGMRTHHHWGALYHDSPGRVMKNGNSGLNLQLMSSMNERTSMDTKQLLVPNGNAGIAGNRSSSGSILHHRDTKPLLSNGGGGGGMSINTGFLHSRRGECMPEVPQQHLLVRDGWYPHNELHSHHAQHHYSHADGRMHYSVPSASSNQHYNLMADTHGIQTLQMMQMMQAPPPQELPLQPKEEPAPPPPPTSGNVEVIEQEQQQEERAAAPKKKRPGKQQKAAASPKPKKPKKAAAPKEANPKSSGKGNSSASSSRVKEVKNVGVVINGIEVDLSRLPTPVCSCTGMPQQCYRWGIGGWQSACCTTTISEHPLPMSTKRRGARIAGRKMSQGAFKKVLERLAGEGFDLNNPIDLRTFWAKHGTNKFVTIR